MSPGSRRRDTEVLESSQVNRAVPDHPSVVALTSCYHNLLRRWADAG